MQKILEAHHFGLASGIDLVANDGLRNALTDLQYFIVKVPQM